MPPMDSNDKNESPVDLVSIILASMGKDEAKKFKQSRLNNRRPQKAKPQQASNHPNSKRTEATPADRPTSNKQPDRSPGGQKPSQAKRGKGNWNRKNNKFAKRQGHDQDQDQGTQNQNKSTNNEPQDHATDNPGFAPMPNSLGVVPANNPPHKKSFAERLIEIRHPSLKEFIRYDAQGHVLPPSDELEETRWGYDSDLYRVIKWYSSASDEVIKQEVRKEIEKQRHLRNDIYLAREAQIDSETRKTLNEYSQRHPIVNMQKMRDMQRRAKDPNCCPEPEVPKLPKFDLEPPKICRPRLQQYKNRKPHPKPRPKPEPKHDPKPDPKPDSRPDSKSQPMASTWVETAADWKWDPQPIHFPVEQTQIVQTSKNISHDLKTSHHDVSMAKEIDKTKSQIKGHQQKLSQESKSKDSTSKQSSRIHREKPSQDFESQIAIVAKPHPVQRQKAIRTECDREYYFRTTPSNFVIGPSPSNPQASHVVGPDAWKRRKALQVELPMIHAVEDEDELPVMAYTASPVFSLAKKKESSSSIYMEPTEQVSLFLTKCPAEIRNQIYENVYDVPILCLNIPDGPLKKWAIPEAHPPKQGGVLSIKKNGQAVLERDPNRPTVRYPGILGSKNPEYTKVTNRRRKKTYHNGLVNTCRQIWHEASSALYHQTTFFFQSTKAFRGFLKSTHPEHLFHVRGLQLDRVIQGVPNRALFNTLKDKNEANFDQACADAVRLMPNLTNLEFNIYVSETPVIFELDQEWLQPFLRFGKLQLRQSRPLEKVKVNIWSRWCKTRAWSRPWWSNRVVQLHRVFADAVERMILTGDPDYAMAEYHKQTGTEFWRNRDHLQHFNYIPWEEYKEPKTEENQTT